MTSKSTFYIYTLSTANIQEALTLLRKPKPKHLAIQENSGTNTIKLRNTHISRSTQAAAQLFSTCHRRARKQLIRNLDMRVYTRT